MDMSDMLDEMSKEVLKKGVKKESLDKLLENFDLSSFNTKPVLQESDVQEVTVSEVHEHESDVSEVAEEIHKVKLSPLEQQVYDFIKVASKDMPVLTSANVLSLCLKRSGVDIHISTVTRALKKLEYTGYINAVCTKYGFYLYSATNPITLNYDNGMQVNLILA